MASTLTTAAPVTTRNRIQSLDVLRGVALFGILLINITGFGLPHAYSDPTVYGGSEGINLWTWGTMTLLFEGTQRGIFSILFGAGFILLTSRLEAAGRTDAADIYYRRTIWLVIFGLIHSYLLLWTGEILFYYGVTALFLFPLRRLAPRAMLALALAGILVGAIWSAVDAWETVEILEKSQIAQAVQADGGELTSEQEDDLEAWTDIEESYKPDKATLTEDIEAHKGSYLDVLTHQAEDNAEDESWGIYRYFFDFFSMMLVGMALFKLGVLDLRRPARVYWVMVIAGYTVGLAINAYEMKILLQDEFSVIAFLNSDWTYDLGRMAMTVGHLGVLLLFCRSGWLGWLQRSLAAVGRMALSNYVSHSLICAFIFYGFGLGLYGDLQRYQLYYVVVAIWAFQLIASPLWLRYFRFGPLEWIWRWLTYLERPALRRRPADGGGPVQAAQPA
ncbi:MAG: DUF418 domain-containing protein [Acidobacteria bacterium]|nr:DUF418 domain-containing protein [Acidobacteriota bacterium]